MSASTTLPPVDPNTALPPSAWKDEVSERLRAHRTRRPRTPDNQPPLPGIESGAPSAVAARVAERYARIPSWREALAAEAAAKAAAEAAALEAARKKAAAEAEAAARRDAEAARREAEAAPPPRPVRSVTAAALDLPIFDDEDDQQPLPPRREPFEETRPLQQELIRYSVSSDSLPAPRSTPAQARAQAAAMPRPYLSEAVDPMEAATVEPARPLPARVIEFPRELVAPRKARPRIAEGPLLDPPPASQDSMALAVPAPPVTSLSGPEFASQLRIFEADPDVAEAPPATAAPRQTLPEWHSIQLDSGEFMRESSAGDSGFSRRSSRLTDQPLHVASFEDRMMSGVVDLALTLAAFLLFVLVFAVCTTHPPAGKAAAAGAAVTLLATWILYQLIFFSLSSATPGMMYTKIALCTFEDENPTRGRTRGRIAAQMLAALPLGLGFLWAVFDEDGLGWHDRITGTYQRSYRDL